MQSSNHHCVRAALTHVRNFSHTLEKLQTVKCQKQVVKKLPGCEHSAATACHRDPSTVSCMEQCSGTLPCCTKTCKATCSSCRSLTIQQTPVQTIGKVARTHHTEHPCERLLYCEHKCGIQCHSKDTDCNSSCRQPCRQQCEHHKCPKPCSEPCAPCMEPCSWLCAHMACPVLCGSVRRLHNRMDIGNSLPLIDMLPFAMRRALPQDNEMRTSVSVW